MSEKNWGLDNFLDHEAFSNPIDLCSVQPNDYVACLRLMLKIRLAERKLAAERKSGVIKGPVHLAVGQEAVAVGVSKHLTAEDRVFGAHRSHSHVLALGTDLEPFFAEILAKKNGLSGGMGGSMHLQNRSVGFYGSVPIVAGTVPVAVGSALAAKLDKSHAVAVAYLGDGAMEEGVVHECLNLAGVMNLPIIFVVENNFFASHMHIDSRQTFARTSRFAEVNGVDSMVVDGNDVAAVSNAMDVLVSNARKNRKPGFIEAVTFRWLGHVDWREDIDVGVNRSEEEVKLWKNRDPIKRLNAALVNSGVIDQTRQSRFEEEIEIEIEQKWKIALNSTPPEKNSILDLVYSEPQQ